MNNYFLAYIKPYVGTYILLLLMFVAINIMSLATPYALKIIIDDIFQKGTFHDLIVILGGLVFIYIIRIAMSFYSNILSVKLSRRIVSNIRNDLYERILNSDVEKFKDRKAGDIVFNLTSDVEKVQNLLSIIIINVINNSLLIVFIVGLLFYLNIGLALITLSIIPFILLNTKLFKKRIKSSYQSFLHVDNEMYNFFLEKLKNIRVIKSFRSYDFEINESEKLHTTWISLAIKNTLWGSLNANITTFLIALTPIFLLIYGGGLIFRDLITVGTLIAFIQYSNKLFSPVIALSNSYNEFIQSHVSMHRLYRYVSDDIKKKKHKASQVVQHIEKIDIENVWVQRGSRNILSGLDVSFEKGKVYGIMGPSGSGKSTIVNLLLNFIIPDKGRVIVDGEFDISDIINVSEHILVIEKENQIFSNTLEYNVGYGSSRFNEEFFTKSIRLANLDSIYENLIKESGSSYITSAGGQLSDGEKQRISIARAVHKCFTDCPSMIIFDESTSSLDKKLEAEIINNLKSNFSETIILIISHRDSIKKFCDINLVLHQNENNSELLVFS